LFVGEIYRDMRLLVMLLLIVSLKSYGGDTSKLYDPHANVAKDIEAALNKAKVKKSMSYSR